MTPRKKQPKGESPALRPRKGRGRQRQRLIEACISALHIYGPSRTTVQKVVAIAKMSPGIVRFYFNSKASMLVASLQFLAAEFEQQLLIPVSKLKSTPVAALELLVDLYLDPELASPRKVSVWYSFWGEASSRQEYYDICGQKDESFAVLVRQLIENLIIETSRPQLDPDGVALGLIGVLEMLWQDFAFKTELDIDRPAAKRRCMAYLRSIFPGQFPAPPGRISRPAAAAGARRAGWAYADARMHALERERLFQGAWTVVGHESQVPRRGDFLSADIGAERLVVVRGESGSLRALRNSCPESPHALVTSGSGCLDAIECRLHGLRFALDGRRMGGAGREDLGVLELSSMGGFLFVRPGAPGRVADDGSLESWLEPQASDGLRMLGRPWEMPVAADWKVVVELWLESMGAGLAGCARRRSGVERGALPHAGSGRSGRMALPVHRSSSNAGGKARRDVGPAGGSVGPGDVRDSAAGLYPPRCRSPGAGGAAPGAAAHPLQPASDPGRRAIDAAGHRRIRLRTSADLEFRRGRVVPRPAEASHS